eukprot:m.55787 g.55787  ORF g.55787 m.55787 type:complete len:307 (+) comp11519_c0_seq4:42-962(+)
MSKVTTSSRSRSFAKAFLAKLDGETEKGETVEKATLKAEKEQKQKQREQTLSRPSRLGLGATVSNNAASGKPELAAGIRKAHRRAKRQHDGSDEDELHHSDEDEEALVKGGTSQGGSSIPLDPLAQLQSELAEKKAKKKKKKKGKKEKKEQESSVVGPSDGDLVTPQQDTATSGATNASNPYNDPSFDPLKEQEAFASNWTAEDESDGGDEAKSTGSAASTKDSKVPDKGQHQGAAESASKPKRKRPKKRSKQKNLHKDNRPAHIKDAIGQRRKEEQTKKQRAVQKKQKQKQKQKSQAAVSQTQSE